MVIRFDREDAPGEAPGKSHYNGFIVPNDAVFSELLALLPERSDLLSVRGAAWQIVSKRDKGMVIGSITVHTDGTYSLTMPEEDRRVKEIEKGEITSRCVSAAGAER